MEAVLIITQEKIQEILMQARERGNRDCNVSTTELVDEIKQNILLGASLDFQEQRYDLRK